MPLPRWLVSNSSSLLYAFLLGLLPLFFSSTVTYYAIRYEPHVRNFDTPAWVGFYVLSSLTMAFALTPTTFIALLSGYFLGWLSILPVSVSYLAASWIGYRAAQRLDGGRFMRNLPRKERAEKLVSNLKNNEFGLIVMARLSPVLPFAVTNVLLSLSGASLRTFLTAGFIGMLPRTMLSIWVGSQARQ
ncbi:MAG: VTT domain-containing protein, partial [Ferruginibacter sp.]|nr:VTT domain-containing protein [Cytophagales bacterium]